MKSSIIHRAIQKIHKETQNIKNYIVLILGEDPARPWSVIRYSADIGLCYILYGASTADYFELRFFEKPHRERKTYFTANQALRFINSVNGLENNLRFYEKRYMYQTLGRFTKREQLFCPPNDYREFEAFFLRHGKAFYKPNNTYCGNGIELWSADHSEIKELYNRAKEQPAILDEPVAQHPDLARLNPDSINTVKIYTMMIKDVCHFVAAELRMGRRGAFVDNIERGGLAAGVDIRTGSIIGSAYDLRMDPYSVHPDTGVQISGYILPNWTELLRFTEECARACPIAYVEWDIAIRKNDCVLIEANANARNSEIQMGAFHGRKKQFQELEQLFAQNNI
jgi:hypothetical protein